MKPVLTIESLREAGLARADAERVEAAWKARDPSADPARTWSRLSREVLEPAYPHAVHRLVYDTTFADWASSRGPRPAWTPTPDESARTHVAEACKRLGLDSYEDFHLWSIAHRAEFWKDAIETVGVAFRSRPERILDEATGIEAPRWLAGASMNIAESCFLAPDGAIAIAYQRLAGSVEKLSYGALDELSNRVANGLRAMGVAPGTAIAIAMPMTIEAVAAYLGIVKAGAVVVSIADSFAADEIRTRLRIAKAEIAVTQDVVVRGGKTLPMQQKVVDAGARTCIVVPHDNLNAVPLRDTDREWEEFLSDETEFEAHAASPDDTTNVLFSSGTTGDPKAIPWTHSTPLKCVMDGRYHHDIHEGEVVAWPTNLGWMMGPWLIYASLVNRATIGLYEGPANTPEFCRFVERAEVRMLGVVPSLVKAWRNGGMTEGCDWSGVRTFSSTGEASNADDYLWLMARARYKPVVEYCGGTEIGGGYITQSLTQPASPAVFSTPSLGLDVAVLDENGKPATQGELFIVPPSIGLSRVLLNRDHHEVYFADTPRGPHGEVLRRHGDEMEVLPGGYYRAHGRADDTMNLGGIKVSSAEIERAVAGIDGVTDVAAIAIDPEDGGPSRLVLHVVAAAGTSRDVAALKTAAQNAISARLNPLFRVYDVRIVDALPRTASNKVMRRVLRDRYRP